MAAIEAARCMQNMRSLHTSLNSYVQQVGHWPQIPEEVDPMDSGEDKAYEDWWIRELESFGVTPPVWQCPTIRRLVSRKDEDGRPRMHYSPTMFDEHPLTPYRWATQPWLIEIGNMHGHGAYLIFPDGSIRTMYDIIPPAH